MIGILSTDGRSVTLIPSGLVLSASEMKIQDKLRGMMVKVFAVQDILSCFAYSSTVPGNLNISAGTLGTHQLAPFCRIYEHGGSKSSPGYLHSLSGEPGAYSTNFEDIFWTDTSPREKISHIHVNSAGQIDLLVLNDVTGNGYSYGKLTRYTDFSGIMTASSPTPVFNDAATLTNSLGRSQKYLCSLSLSSHNAYFGIALHSYNETYQDIVSAVKLTEAALPSGTSFSLSEDDWFVTVSGFQLPVSDAVQVYSESADRWLSGSAGIKTAIASGQPLTLWYDRTPTTGGQIRIIEINK